MKSKLRFQRQALAWFLPFVVAGVHAPSAWSQSRTAAAPQVPSSDVKTLFVEPSKHAPAEISTVRSADEPQAAAPAAGPKSNYTAGDDHPLRPALDRVYHDVGADGALWARGENWKSRFGADGVTIVPRLGSAAPRSTPIELQLRDVTVGGAPLGFQLDVSPQRDADRIVYSRGTLREVYDLSSSEVEQSFIFDALPSRGEVVVHVAVASDLEKTSAADRIELSNEHGRVTCSRAVAVDAAGVRTVLGLSWNDGALEIRVPTDVVERAVLPLVVDPVISFVSLSANTSPDFVPDVSFDSVSGLTAYVWEEEFNVLDHDVAVDVRNANNAQISFGYVDVSTNDWRNPKIANNRYTGNFLVVAEAGSTPARQIASRTVNAAGSMGPVFLLSPGVIGDNVLPDVGGDFFTGSSSFYGVVWQRNFAADDSDILFATVDPTTGMASAPTYISNAAHTLDRHPSMSKGTGDGSNNPSAWNVVWDHQFSPGDRDIYGAQIGWDGSIVTQPFSIDTSSADDAYPTASTFLTRTGTGDIWLCAYQRTIGTNNHDLIGTVLDGSVFLATANLSQLDGSDQAQDQIAASADSDGHQFVMAYMESYQHSLTDLDIYFSQFAFAGGSLYATLPHQQVSANFGYEAWPQVAADHSSAGAGSCFAVTWADANSPNGSRVYGARTCGKIGGAVSTTCSGTAPGTACPCGPGSPGRGCPNSVNLSGALLTSTGDAAITADSFVLHAEGMPTTSSCLYFQGSAVVSAGVFGDGLRCTGGTVVRLGTKTNVNGASQYPSSGNSAISVKGMLGAAGGQRAYQVWYRNATSFCTSATFNLTNGLRAVWVP